MKQREKSEEMFKTPILCVWLVVKCGSSKDDATPKLKSDFSHTLHKHTILLLNR